MKIIFLLINVFSKRDYERHGFEIFKKKGFKVEAWDCLDLFDPSFEYKRKHTIEELDLNIDSNFLKKFYKIKDVINEINLLSQKDIFIIPNHRISKNYLKIFNEIYSSKISFIYFFLGNLPIVGVNTKQKIKIFLKYPNIFFYKLRNLMLTKSKNKSIKYQPSYILYSGSKILNSLNNKFPAVAKKISVPSFDYDLFFKQDKSLNFNIKKKFAVYIDEANSFHPDLLNSDVEKNCDEEIFNKEILNFFDYFEKKTDLEIVIAAHPKVNYDGKKKIFGNRKIFFNLTKESIKKSNVVIAHASASISFAILANKPLIFLNSRNFISSYQYLIESFSLTLNNKSIDISRNKYKLGNFKIDYYAYENYRNDYLKENNIKNQNPWITLCNVLLG